MAIFIYFVSFVGREVGSDRILYGNSIEELDKPIFSPQDIINLENKIVEDRDKSGIISGTRIINIVPLNQWAKNT